MTELSVADDLGRMTVAAFLESLGAKTPAPGGGAAASMVGATGASLARMVVAYSIGKRSLEAHRAALEEAQRALERAEALFLRLADEDAEAYGQVNALGKLAEDDPARAGYSAAVGAAISVPMAVSAACVDVLRLLESLSGKTNHFLVSDLEISAILLESAARSGGCNVGVNLSLLSRESDRGRIRSELASLLACAAASCERIRAGAEA